MVSYAEIGMQKARRRKAMDLGLREFLGIPRNVRIYLDNGAFYFLSNGGRPDAGEYREFVRNAKPDWWPIRFDAIPTPQMSPQKQRACFETTMKMNRAYLHDGYVPVVHVGRFLNHYIEAVGKSKRLSAKPRIALGGLVPNLLRAPRAMPYEKVLENLQVIRETYAEKEIHVFGIGGTATLHLAGLLGFDSLDSSGWRNRAARGIVQLPGCGDRMVANLGNWRGRQPSKEEWGRLAKCRCSACNAFGWEGIRASGLAGFSHRATHNLWILLKEAEWIEERLKRGTYGRSYKRRLDNSTYLPMIEKLAKSLF
jgi:queuine/archaeosine tRNA-ribosyltransferase